MCLLSLHNKARAMAWVAVTVLLLQPQMVLAAPTDAEPSAAAISVVDVALQPGGVLQGQLVNGQGQQLAGRPVRVANGLQQWNAVTDAEGRFAVQGLTGASYQIQMGHEFQMVRAWSEGTAPPKAVDSVLMVPDDSVVLGQSCGSPVCGSGVCGCKKKHPMAGAFLLGGIVAAAIAIPVALHNSDDDPASP